MNENNPSHQSPEKTINARMEGWRQANPKATLSEIEDRIDIELAQLRKQLVGASFNDDEAQTDVKCPKCEKKMVNNGMRTRQLQIKGGETVKFERIQKRCRACGTTFFPPR